MGRLYPGQGRVARLRARVALCLMMLSTPIADVRRAASLAGAQSFEVVDGHPRMFFANGWGAARCLLELARMDARRPWVRVIAARMRAAAGGTDEGFARALQSYGRGLPFFPEDGELFQGPALTMDRGGDCDCHARLLYALAKGGGLRTELAFLHNRGGPTHVYVRVLVGGAWRALETTLAAEYGEDPFVAARRLGVVRDDMRSPETRTMGEIDNFDGDGNGPKTEPDPEVARLDAELQRELTAASESGGTEIGAMVHPVVTGETARLDDAFFSANVEDESADGGTAEMRAAVLLNESGLNPASKNSIGCVGMNQFCPGTLELYWRGTADEYRQLSAGEQMKFIRAFWRDKARALGPTVWQGNGRNLYWSNFLPDSYAPGVDDAWLIAAGPRLGDDKNPATWPGGQDFYVRANGTQVPYRNLLKANPSFVTVEGGQRVIRASALSRAIENAIKRNPRTWAEVLARINYARGGGLPAGSGVAGVIALLGLGAAGLVALHHYLT